MAAQHTIILVQPNDQKSTRTYMENESISNAIDEVCQMFETKLKELNPTLANITYDVSDLFSYIDSLRDICALVFNKRTMAYEPQDKEWIKSQIFQHLKRQVA